MKKHYSLLLPTCAVALLVAAVVPFQLANPVRITQASYDRIQPGMTQREVETILGVPPGDYRKDQRRLASDLCRCDLSMNEDRREEWIGDDCFFQVGFVEPDLVLWTRFEPAGRWWTFLDNWLSRVLW